MASLCQDIVREILLRLQLKPLLRFRSVCKFWREMIDSTSFKQSHIHHHANNDDDDDTFVAVRHMDYPSHSLSFSLSHVPEVTEPGHMVVERFWRVEVMGPVNGLFCIYPNVYANWGGGDILVCNPGLALIKRLPVDGYPNCLPSHYRHVALGFHDMVHDYKVLQLLLMPDRSICGLSGRHVHGLVYSKTTNSWRELARDFPVQDHFRIHESIQSSCTDGGTAHWLASQGYGEDLKPLIVSFDMKSEVFRILEISDIGNKWRRKIYAERDKFVLIDYNRDHQEQELSIYEARIEENSSILHCYVVAEVIFTEISFWRVRPWSNDCVALYRFCPDYVVIYDFYRKEIVRRIPFPVKHNKFDVLSYQGSFITP